MYKILISDDESIVLDSLQYIINQNYKGECGIQTAKNGRQAIELAETYQPDIVLMDIHLPGINGLKAMEEILRINPRIRFLILTAYDNFDYAKEALRLGAVNYLMKPISKNTIVEQLSSVMRMIDQDREKRREELSRQEKIEATMPILESSFVMNLVMQSEYQDSSEPYRRLLNIETPYGNAMVIGWSELNHGGRASNPVSVAVQAHKLVSSMMETIHVYFKAYLSGIMGDKLVVILPQADMPVPYEKRLSMIERTRVMAGAVGKLLDADVRVGIGSSQPWALISRSYQEALRALRQGKRHVTHSDDLQAYAPQTDKSQLESDLLEAVSFGKSIQAHQDALLFADVLSSQKNSTLNALKARLLETLMQATRTLRLCGGDESSGQSAAAKLSACQTVPELTCLFVEQIRQIASEVTACKSRPDGAIVRARKYIQSNFKRSLALPQVAREINISPYYFSKLFKEETGQNFTDYLTRLRMDEAKQMLEAGEASIKRICLECGFSNSNYFSRLFKKNTGKTPTEFRDSMRE